MSAQLYEGNKTVGFPQLNNCGGIELLRTSQNCRTLKLIDCCWSVRELKATVGPQANIYIRPIQKNLSTKLLQTDNTKEMPVTSSCHGCSKDFGLRKLRDHMQFCPGALDLQDLESDDDFVSDVSVRISENQTATSTSVSFQNDIDQLIITDHSDVEAGRENATNAETIIYVINSSTSNSATVNAIIHENNSSIASSTDNSSSATPSNDTDCPISVIVTKAIEYCRKGNISDLVEILKKLQDVIVTGRPLEVEDIAVCAEGDTNFILVDIINVLSTGMDEISAITNLTKTLEVQFYNEVAADYGGPRKEFFRLILREIKEKYFDNGLRELLASDYETIGKVFGWQAASNIPIFVSFTLIPMTYKKLTSLVQPQFSEEGTNNNQFDKTVYAAFLRYLREVASGRREAVCLESVLQFITGTDEKPVLGFKIPVNIRFTSSESFLPTANTCINCLTLPHPPQIVKLPDDTTLFHLYDYSFANSIYGLK
ncbi:hypothetical protein CHS0354_036992 [Potamilus streckersoni]|uniref:HECT domain-containing protein n=1 Tax=Potamilus streckersoni TaxID=2493646 RepID=A0AAE0SL85_9BIVA|nr:hypothetical protein CHS0354_036992 [Potamilus streckersoni]